MRLASASWLASALLLAAATPAGGQPSTVILVRHAEKAAMPASDPGLTEVGAQRARDLAAVLAGARVTSIVTTHLQRTQLTARHVTDATGLTPIVMRAGVTAHADSVAARVLRLPPGDVVLVVGHSNTIPGIIGALGGPKMPDLCDEQHSMLFVLEFPATGPPRLIKARYGAADPPDSDACSRSMR